MGPPGQHPSTSRPGDPHWFRSSSSIGTVKGGQAAPPRRDLSHLARDEQACGRAILCKRSTVGFHSAGKLHAGAVGHRRRAGREVRRATTPWDRGALTGSMGGPAQAAPPRRGPSHQGYCGRTVAAPFAPPSVPLAPADKSTPGLSVTNGVPGGAPCNQPLPWPRSAHRLLRPTPCAD